ARSAQCHERRRHQRPRRRSSESGRWRWRRRWWWWRWWRRWRRWRQSRSRTEHLGPLRLGPFLSGPGFLAEAQSSALIALDYNPWQTSEVSQTSEVCSFVFAPDRPPKKKIRNSKLEIRNEFEARNPNDQSQLCTL